MRKRQTDIEIEDLNIVENIDDLEIVSTFSKEEFLKSNQYKNRIDILSTLLDDGQFYTISEVNNMMDEFYGGEF